MNPVIKSKLKLAFLLLITIVPITLASFAFRSAMNSGGFGTVNHGELISPPMDITALDMRNAEGELIFRTFEEEVEGVDSDDYEPRPWLMVYATTGDCDESCRDRVYMLQQLHIALGKDIQRVRRYYLYAGPDDIDQPTRQYFRQNHESMGLAFGDAGVIRASLEAAGIDPRLDESMVFLVDPVGNVMMYYLDSHSPEEIKDDLENLLDYSSLG